MSEFSDDMSDYLDAIDVYLKFIFGVNHVVIFSQKFSSLPLVNVFTYTTTRSLFAFFTAFVLSLVFGRPLFKMLYLSGYKDYPSEYGEDTVGSKKYTPQMGGLLIALTGLLSMVLWTDLLSPRIWIDLRLHIFIRWDGFFDDTAKKNARMQIRESVDRRKLYHKQFMVFSWVFGLGKIGLISFQ